MNNSNRQWTNTCRRSHAYRMWLLSDKAQLWGSVMDALGGKPKRPKYNPHPAEFEQALQARGEHAKQAFEGEGGNAQWRGARKKVW